MNYCCECICYNFLLFYRFAHTLATCDSGLKPILEKIFNLYMVSTVEKNLGNLLILGIVQPDQVCIKNNDIFWQKRSNLSFDDYISIPHLSFVRLEP